jgi:hypothetical protein
MSSSRAVALSLALLMVLALIVPTSAAAANRSTMDVRATYEARAKLTWSAGRLDVWSRARIQNTSGHGIERIYFNLVPARIGNMKNLADAALMESPEGQQRYADAVVKGIAGFLGSRAPVARPT